MKLEIAILVLIILLISWYFQEPVLLLVLIIPGLYICQNIIGGALEPRKYQPTYIDMKNIKTITGPISMYILKNKELNKTVILFGDRHDFKTIDCHNESSAYLVDYLIWLFNNSNFKMDIFTELPYTADKKINYKKDYGNSSLINNYLDYFKNCHVDLLERKICQEKYPHIQFHNADTRKLLKDDLLTEIINISNHDIFNILNVAKSYKQDFAIKQFISLFIKVMNKNKNLNNEIKNIGMTVTGTLMSFIGSIFADTKIMKNLWKINNDNIQEKILAYMHDNLEKFIYEHVNMIGINKLIAICETNELNISNFYYYEPFIIGYLKLIDKLSIMIMDYYLLSRMFRDFVSNYNIILAGDHHINNYVNILKELNFQVLFSKQSETKCIDITDLPELDIKLK